MALTLLTPKGVSTSSVDVHRAAEFGNDGSSDGFPFQGNGELDSVDAVNESKEVLTADGWEEQSQGILEEEIQQSGHPSITEGTGNCSKDGLRR